MKKRVLLFIASLLVSCALSVFFCMQLILFALALEKNPDFQPPYWLILSYAMSDLTITAALFIVFDRVLFPKKAKEIAKVEQS